jgi:ABC-type polysaccharide/polyol phosphate export permease
VDAASARFAWQYAMSQLRVKYRYTALGVLWNVLEPGLYLCVLSVVFAVVNRMRVGDYSVYLFSALVPWRYFEKTVSTCTDAIVQGDWLLRKQPVSPFALPLARWVVASAEFTASFVALALVLSWAHVRWSLPCLVLPLAAIPWGLSGLGAGLACAVGYTFFRDLRPVVHLLLMFAFFSAPILFKADVFPPGSPQAHLVAWHPLTYLAALFQKPLAAGTWPSPADWIVSLSVSSALVLAGAIALASVRARIYFHL